MDAAKAPGYRGTTVCSPVSSKSSTTPPSLPSLASYPSYSPPAQSPAHYSQPHTRMPMYAEPMYPNEAQEPYTTVTMSRLNPRAPDFRAPTSQPVYSAPTPTTYMPPHAAILANNNVISFPLGKFPPQQRPNGQTQRWHLEKLETNF